MAHGKGNLIEALEADVGCRIILEHDSRYLLVQRILATNDFVRSPQLSKFLLYIYVTTFEGRGQILSEQHIGVAVFGREPDYDSAADTIVRSHALRLRRRLEQYFLRSGKDESIRLIIPKGGYTPVFAPTLEHQMGTDGLALEPDSGDGESASQRQRENLESEAQSSVAELAVHSKFSAPVEETKGTARQSEHTPAVIWRYRISTAILALLCIGLATGIALHLRTHIPIKRHHILWERLFTDDQPTHIVLGDSGLVLFHAVAREHVSLHDYLNDDVSKQMPFVQHVDPGFAQFLLHRRYTSVVDATALTRLLRLPEAIPERTLVHYSRDMHLNDFKSGNVIIIGAQEAVPWVELFEAHMDFLFIIDNPEKYSSFLNRHPQAGELENYNSHSPSTAAKVYAVIAFLPNLSATGNVLILEGHSMVGTEAAVDLICDDDRLIPILNKIRKPDGSLPHFEMLLETDSLGESAGPARVIAIHLHD